MKIIINYKFEAGIIIYNKLTQEKGCIISFRSWTYYEDGNYTTIRQYYICWGERYEWEEEGILSKTLIV